MLKSALWIASNRLHEGLGRSWPALSHHGVDESPDLDVVQAHLRGRFISRTRVDDSRLEQTGSKANGVYFRFANGNKVVSQHTICGSVRTLHTIQAENRPVRARDFTKYVITGYVMIVVQFLSSNTFVRHALECMFMNLVTMVFLILIKNISNAPFGLSCNNGLRYIDS